jgi:hypothetical protein
MRRVRFLALTWLVAVAITVSAAPVLDPAEARRIAREAYIYGYPMVDHYRIQHAYFVDRANSDYKGAWNQVINTPRVFTPEDKAMQSANADTPYSFVGLDLRAEPVVLTLPAVEQGRYYSVQLVDAYTHNFDYIGSRTTGNMGGDYLVAGPEWTGEAPEGIKAVFRSETEFAFAFYRTQLFSPADIDNVKKVQAGYRAVPLSAYLGKPVPVAMPAVDFVKPLTPAEQRSDLRFFDVLNFTLGFAPVHASEPELMERFAKLGIGAGQNFSSTELPAEIRQAISDGMADAWAEFDELKNTKFATGQLTSDDVFGTRSFLDNNYLYRMAAAVLGIYGNSREEAIYPSYLTDSSGQPLNGETGRYMLHFPAGKLPPVEAFWSLTLYELPSSLLSANELNRYLINSAMLPDLKKDPDGGVTLHIKHDSPGAARESNWLPAPNGPFWINMRLYVPEVAALNGEWSPPPLVRLD